MVEHKSSGLAAILSFLIPGLGQIYNGEITKGILFIVLALVFAVLILFLIGIPLYVILWIYAIYDGYQGAERHNRAHPPMQQPVMYAPPPGAAPGTAPMAPPGGQPPAEMMCPECGRRYSTTQGRFCTVDGAELRPAV